MKYDNIYKATFVDRPNRFIANLILKDEKIVCHVKNTGRCKELLIKGVNVYIQKSDNPSRKTAYDLIAVEKGERLINMDSQVPNKVAEDWLRANLKGLTYLKGEKKYKNSRFDFYYETTDSKGFVEVKGVTLENDGVVSFPDAPSERAIKHLGELIEAKKEGYEAMVLFVVQMKNVRYFTPNYDHPDFVEALKRAKINGVEIVAVDSLVTADEIVAGDRVEVVLS